MRAYAYVRVWTAWRGAKGKSLFHARLTTRPTCAAVVACTRSRSVGRLPPRRPALTALRQRRGAEDDPATGALQACLDPAVCGERIRKVTIELGGRAGVV